MNKREGQAKILEICLKRIGLTTSLTEELDIILAEQFKPENAGEVAGSAFYRESKLELEIICSKAMKDIQELLHSFESGDYAVVSQLYNFARKVTNQQHDYHGHKGGLEAICLCFEILADKKGSIQLPTEMHKSLVEDYKDLLRSYYEFTPLEMKADQPGFVGIFHVHNDGSEPSFADVQESSRIHIPYLVVSATPDYQQSGVKLYLVHAGAFELLYQGPLKPKQ